MTYHVEQSAYLRRLVDADTLSLHVKGPGLSEEASEVSEMCT